jgi:hypothetical protein
MHCFGKALARFGGIDVADTDEQAFADMSTLPPRISLVDQNKAIAEGVRQSDCSTI